LLKELSLIRPKGGLKPEVSIVYLQPSKKNHDVADDKGRGLESVALSDEIPNAPAIQVSYVIA
jgi:hypothetical protein